MREFREGELDQLRHVAGRLAGDFPGVFSVETIERFVSESFARLAESAKVAAFLALLTERFARERLRALAQVQGAFVSDMPEVLFVCVHNAGRSQMAAGLLDHYAQGRVYVRSAGSAPVDQINPAVVTVMEEVGVDLTKGFPKPLTDEVARAADVIVTMGSRRRLPGLPRQARPRLGTRGPGGPERRGRARHPR